METRINFVFPLVVGFPETGKVPIYFQIKYARDMKRVPNSWKVGFLLLSVIVLVLTVVSDQYPPTSKSMDHSPVHDHSHDHDDPSKSPDSLDKAFDQTPDPGTILVDPVREHRMAIFHYNEGNKFLSKGDWKEAVNNYKMALHHDKTLNEVYINMSSAYLKGQRYEEVKKTLETLKEQAPENPHLYYNLACYYSLTHQEKASLEALQQSMRLGYKNREGVHTDPDLANLRQTPEFEQWIKTLR